MIFLLKAGDEPKRISTEEHPAAKLGLFLNFCYNSVASVECSFLEAELVLVQDVNLVEKSKNPVQAWKTSR